MDDHGTIVYFGSNGGRIEMVRQVELVEVIGRLSVRARNETGRLVRGW